MPPFYIFVIIIQVSVVNMNLPTSIGGEVHFAKRRKVCKLYGPDIEIVIAKPYARIITEGTSEFKKEFGRKKESQSLFDWGVFIVAKARALGYHIVEFERQGDVGTVIMDREVVIRNAITEKDIESYIKQFNVERKTAVEEIAQIVLDEYTK